MTETMEAILLQEYGRHPEWVFTYSARRDGRHGKNRVLRLEGLRYPFTIGGFYKDWVGALVDLPRFRGEMRAWDQALWLYVMLSSGSWHSLVRPRRSHSSVPTRALTRLPRAVAVKDGRFLRPPEGLVLDGCEHGGRLVCVAIDGCCMMPVFVVNR